VTSHFTGAAEYLKLDASDSDTLPNSMYVAVVVPEPGTLISSVGAMLLYVLLKKKALNAGDENQCLIESRFWTYALGVIRANESLAQRNTPKYKKKLGSIDPNRCYGDGMRNKPPRLA
jgi:hypothetical protein